MKSFSIKTSILRENYDNIAMIAIHDGTMNYDFINSDIVLVLIFKINEGK
jgi:hypothetical protein